MILLDPSLDMPLQEKSYADDCIDGKQHLGQPLCHFLIDAHFFFRNPNHRARLWSGPGVFVERHRHILSRACVGMVRKGDDIAQLLVLLGTCVAQLFDLFAYSVLRNVDLLAEYSLQHQLPTLPRYGSALDSSPDVL